MRTAEGSSYFVRFRGRVTGPYTLDRLRGMAGAGQLSPLHELSADQAAWTAASDVPGLLPAAPAPAPAGSSTLAAARPEPAAERWYYLTADGTRTGPVDRAELVGLYRQGQVAAETPVWCKGMGDWVSLRDAGLAPAAGQAPRWLDDPGAGPARAPGVAAGLAALGLGLLALPAGCLGFVPVAGLVFLGVQLVLGVLAVCLGAAGLRTRGRGFAGVGLAAGVLAVLVFLAMVTLTLAVPPTPDGNAD